MPNADTPSSTTGGGDAKETIRGAPISRAIDRFQESLNAVRHLDEQITPQAIALDEERLTPAALSAVRRLPTARRERLKAWIIKEEEEAAAETQEEDDPPDSEEDRTTKTAVSGSGEVDGVARSDDAQTNQDNEPDVSARELSEILGSREAAFELSQHLYHTRISPPRATLLRRSLMVTAFGAFEVLIGSLMRQYFVANPGALGEEPKFSLKDLQEFGSLDEAREAAIGTQVDSVLQADLAQWEKWFKVHLELNLETFCIDRQVLAEMFQRRHVIVHNDGRVSRLYLRRLAGMTNLPELHAQLSVTDTYLEAVIESLETLGVLLGTGAWSKLYPNEKELAMSILLNRTYKLMLGNHWTAVQKLCQVACVIKADESNQQVFTVNGWLAEKRLGNLESARDAIEGWEVSALAPEFKFVRFALLDDLDAAFPLARQLLDGNFLDLSTLAEWPVLAEFREDHRYTLISADNAERATHAA